MLSFFGIFLRTLEWFHQPITEGQQEREFKAREVFEKGTKSKKVAQEIYGRYAASEDILFIY